MKATLEVDIQPFTVPNFVRPTKETGAHSDVCYPLSDLSAKDLDRLCHEFRMNVFEKAKKKPVG